MKNLIVGFKKQGCFLLLHYRNFFMTLLSDDSKFFHLFYFVMNQDYTLPPLGDGLAGLVVKASSLGEEEPGFESCLRLDFPGRVIPVTLKLALQWLPCQAPGIIGSALGLVGPVSVYCDWVR